ncbi:MAG TPA: mobile mystery protein A [Roseateles sp.]|uniref:mobile mystery protein A n=1 Tax=Roseateles sp. TaxID=1971397 RepID=UPI002EDB32A7
MRSHSNRLARKRLDTKLAPFRALTTIDMPRTGWLRAIRQALGMSSRQLAERLGLASQSVDDMEKTEATGTIRLDTLRRAAAALDCTLVYALVPNQSLQAMVERRARALATAALDRVDQTMALEDQRVENPDREELIEDYIRQHIRDRDLWERR